MATIVEKKKKISLDGLMYKTALILLVDDNNFEIELTRDAFRKIGLPHRLEVSSARTNFRDQGSSKS